MVTAFLVIGGILVGLLLLLAVIVGLSARPHPGRGVTTASRGSAPRVPGWVVDAGQPHPDAWSPLSQTSTEIRALR